MRTNWSFPTCKQRMQPIPALPDALTDGGIDRVMGDPLIVLDTS